MFELIVKTLDGRDHSFTLPEEISIAQFKQQIARSLDVPVDQQRLIFRGKMLSDETILKADEMDRKVVHLVTRPPPSTTDSSTLQEGRNASDETGAQPGENVFVGEINISSFIPPNRIQEILRYVIESVGINADETNFTVSDRGRGIEIQIEIGPNPETVMRREVTQRLAHIRHMISVVNRHINELEIRVNIVFFSKKCRSFC
ncbi:hypothetical protein GJ496_000700 [Pomphorhynchus laevis]|nr:hypothetical protein GJ496_000700 [Pomphorhynchus laevis]